MGVQIVGVERQPLIKLETLREAVTRGALTALGVGVLHVCGYLVMRALGVASSGSPSFAAVVDFVASTLSFGAVAGPLVLVERWAERDGHSLPRVYATAWVSSMLVMAATTVGSTYALGVLQSGGSIRSGLEELNTLWQAGWIGLGVLSLGLAVVATPFAGLVTARVRGTGFWAQVGRAYLLPLILLSLFVLAPFVYMWFSVGLEFLPVSALVLPFLIYAGVLLLLCAVLAASWRWADRLSEGWRTVEPLLV